MSPMAVNTNIGQLGLMEFTENYVFCIASFDAWRFTKMQLVYKLKNEVGIDKKYQKKKWW